MLSAELELKFRQIARRKRRTVRAQFERGRAPNFPARMFYAVFAAAAPERRITPVMFGYKFGVRPCWNRLRFASRRHLKRFPFAAPSPGVFHLQILMEMFDLVLHRHGNIIFSVECSCYQSDCATRHKFPNENDA